MKLLDATYDTAQYFLFSFSLLLLSPLREALSRIMEHASLLTRASRDAVVPGRARLSRLSARMTGK